MARLEALATWTESLRDTIAGAVGLEQAIPASSRVAAPLLQAPLAQLVNRLHTRVPMPEALRRFADDLDDPGADLIVAALIINARLRGPGLRDLLGALAGSAREELDMRRKVNAERRSTRRSAQIVTGISVTLALGCWPCSTPATCRATRASSASSCWSWSSPCTPPASCGCASWRRSSRPTGCCAARPARRPARPSAGAAAASPARGGARP